MGYETEKYYQRLNREIEWRENEWFYNLIGKGLVELFSPKKQNTQNNNTGNQYRNTQYNSIGNQYKNTQSNTKNMYNNPVKNTSKLTKQQEYKFTPISPFIVNCQRCGKKIRNDDIECPYCNKIQAREYKTCPKCYNSVKSSISKCPRCNTNL